MRSGVAKVGRVEISYDLSRAENETVIPAAVKVDGLVAFDFLRAKLTAAAATGKTLAWLLTEVEAVLPDGWSAAEDILRQTPGELAFRDAADRFHQSLVNPIWTLETRLASDQVALAVMLRALSLALKWEAPSGSAARYVHKGELCMWAAVSSIRLGNIDRGLLLLEAGEETDRRTYELAGQPGGERTRPGALTFVLDPRPGNALKMDVDLIRRSIEARLMDFVANGGAPAGDPLSMADLDAYLFRDPATRAAGKFCIAAVLWRAHNIDDPNFSGLPREGAFARRRLAELLLGVDTAAEELIRQVEGSLPPTARYRQVVSRLSFPEWPGATEDSAERQLGALEKSHLEDIRQCLSAWQTGNPQGLSRGWPWYLRWVEQGRFVRNQLAHSLDTPPSVWARWNELEEIAWFYLFCAVWLTRRKDPTRSKLPSAPPPSAAPPGVLPLSLGSLLVQPSGAIGLPPQLLPPGVP